MFKSFATISFALVVLTAPTHAHWNNAVQVTTGTGTYVGIINETTPNVRQFRNIPYGLAPEGDRRWLPPVAVTSSADTIYDSTKFPPSCPQYGPYNVTYSDYIAIVPEFVIAPTRTDQYAKTSEDCLSLAVWTPVGAEQGDALPVVMFMTGGGWDTGGIDIPYQMPHRWVQRTKGHIVVTINYRVNIFGFPHAAGVEDQNLGILDQRLALEWVRDNIEAFGGDPSHITLWGQSAGAGSTDILNFAYPDDPIAESFFMNSGSVFLANTEPDTTYTNFTFVANHFGCDTSTPETELACMRAIDFQSIIDFVFGYGENKSSSEPSLGFRPTPDENIVFSNYTARYEQGLLADRPALFTSNADEGTMFVAMLESAPSPSSPYGVWSVDEAAAEQTTLSVFQCTAAQSAMLRTHAGRKTYRWQYAGNFSNVSPLLWQGAYHSSDLPMLFGSHPDHRGSSTEEEYKVSEAMQDHLLAFAKDPIEGPAQLGWTDTTNGQILRFGVDGEVVTSVDVGELDSACGE